MTQFTYKFYCLCLLSLCTLQLFAQQNKIEKANKKYESLEYIDAIDIYTSVVENGVEDPKLIYRLANANYFNAKYEEATKWYDKYYNIAGISPNIVDNYRYGQCLKTQKRYKEADSLLTTYYNYKGERYTSIANPENYKNSVIDNEGVFRIKNYNFNSDLSEYPASIDNNQLYVVGHGLNSKKRAAKRSSTSDIYTLDQSTGEHSALLGGVNSPYNEGPMVITNDGQTLFFSRNDYIKNRLKKSSEDVVTINLYRAELVNGQWGKIRAFPFNSEEYSVGHPALSVDNKTLYFVSNKPGGKGETDLYKVAIFDDGTYGEPKNLTALNTTGKEMFPFVDPHDGSIYFSSTGPNSIGGLDVFISKLSSDGSYKRAYNLGKQINSTYDDFSFLIGDNRIGYFASNRVNDVGLDDIYSFKATRDFAVPEFLNLNGHITDYETNTPLNNVKLSLFNKKNEEIASVISNADGYYEFDEMESSKLFYVLAEKPEYQMTGKNITQDQVYNRKPLDIQMLGLGQELPENFALNGNIKDKNTGQPITNAKITLLDIYNKPIGKSVSDTKGNYNFDSVPTRRIAFIRAEKEGYQTEEEDINVKDMKNGTLNKDINLVKRNVPLALGNDISSILNTIYFDYGKSDIRPDAQVELEKIVQVLKKFSSISIHIESHTDSRGRDVSNLQLSQRRARATYKYITDRGVAASRLSYKGYGESQLINACGNGIECSDEVHSLNRRSSFKIAKIN